MYAKLFTSLYQGTLRGRPDEILVFTNLIAHADQNGCVDIHYRAIADEVGIPIKRVKTAIANLEAPDPESRSPEEDGKRLIPLDEHRAWGWHIVNYAKYRAIRNEDDRKEQNRLAQERFRNKQKVSGVSNSKPPSAEVSPDKPKQKQIQKQEEDKETPKSAPKTHPAIEAVRSICLKYPPKVGWDDIVAAIGDSPDQQRLAECFKAWSLKGNKPTNYAWATDWYVNGVPEYNKPQGRANGTYVPTEADKKDMLSPYYEMPPPRPVTFDDMLELQRMGKDTEPERWHDRELYEQAKSNILGKRLNDFTSDIERYEHGWEFRERFGEATEASA